MQIDYDLVWILSVNAAASLYKAGPASTQYMVKTSEDSQTYWWVCVRSDCAPAQTRLAKAQTDEVSKKDLSRPS